MSLFFFSNIVAHVSSARRSCISGYCEFHRGVRLQRNAEQPRKHRQADSLIRTRQLHVVSCINQDMWNSFCRVVRSLGRIALVTYLVFGSECWFDFNGRV